MKAAFHDSMVDYVVYMGITENYPEWFQHEVLDDIYMDSDRYTFWVPAEERRIDYYEKTLVEDYSVFIKKRSNGEVFHTTYDAFLGLYDVFHYHAYNNAGIAAWSEDTIEYVECQPGVLHDQYPDWFYEYFTESVHFPQNQESIFIYDITTAPPISTSSRNVSVIEPLDSDTGQVSVTSHCVFLRNDYGEIRHMDYDTFVKYYNPGPFTSFGYC